MDEEEKRAEKKYRAQEAILKEHLWYSLTTVTINFALMNVNTGINRWVVILFSMLISMYALRIILQRAISYHNCNLEYNKQPIDKFNSVKAFRFVVKEFSGALFYFIIVFFSFIGVVLTKFNFGEIWRNLCS
jgi:hypothetical protein